MPFFSSLLFKIMANYRSHWRVCKEERTRILFIIWCEFIGGAYIGFNSLATCFYSLAEVLPLFKLLLLGCVYLHRKVKQIGKWNSLPLAAASPYSQSLTSMLPFVSQSVMKIDSSTFEINNIKAEITWSPVFGISHTSLFWDYLP